MVDGRNGNTSFLTEIVYGGDFGFGLESWHESTADSCHKLDVIDESDKISLDDENSSSVKRSQDKLNKAPYGRSLNVFTSVSDNLCR